MKRIIYSLLVPLLGIIACNKVNDEPIVRERHKCKLNLELFVDTYDLSTKTSGDNLVWENGTKLFLNFSNNGNPVIGVAEYDASDDSWALSYTGDLNLADKEQVSVYFFTAYNANDSQDVITLTPESAIYSDTDGTYSFLDDGELRVMAHLAPLKGRVRFKGEKGSQFSVIGVTTNLGFNVANQRFTLTNTEITTVINSDGFSPYIYGELENTDSRITVNNQYCRFEKTCGSNVLAKGKSGYLSLPIQDNCLGWKLIPVVPTVQTLSPGKVSYISPFARLNGQILSDGGDEIIEYGFLCGTSPENLSPILVGKNAVSTFSYDKKASGDSTYYYCAYAKNRLGMSVGDVKTFKPKSDYPEVATAKVNERRGRRCTINGRINNLNNSGLLDYGFRIEIRYLGGGGLQDDYYYSMTRNMSLMYPPYYYTYFKEICDIEAPFDFSYTINLSDFFVQVKCWAYAMTGVGYIEGEPDWQSMEYEDDW